MQTCLSVGHQQFLLHAEGQGELHWLYPTFTINVTNSSLNDFVNDFQELPAGEIVHLLVSKKLFVGGYTHTKQRNRKTKSCFYLLNGYFSDLRDVSTPFSHL